MKLVSVMRLGIDGLGSQEQRLASWEHQRSHIK